MRLKGCKILQRSNEGSKENRRKKKKRKTQAYNENVLDYKEESKEKKCWVYKTSGS
jgi:hypothetical protein